jgi:SHS2 domain-containing protein
MHPEGFEQLDHTADLCLRLYGPSVEAVFAQGAYAVVSLLTEAALVQPAVRRAVALEGLDREDLLVRWLNEVLVLAIAEGFLVAEVDVRVEGVRLAGSVAGEAGAQHKITSELKAATYHHLAFTGADDHFEARVVIDV